MKKHNFKKETFKVGKGRKDYYIYHEIKDMAQLEAFINNELEEPFGFRTKSGELAVTSKKTAVKWMGEALLKRGVYIVKTEEELDAIFKSNGVANTLENYKEHQKVVDGIDFDGIGDFVEVNTKEEEDVTFDFKEVQEEMEKQPLENDLSFNNFFWTFGRAGMLMLISAMIIFMVFHEETRLNNTSFYVSWIVAFSGILALLIGAIYRNWNRLKD